LKKRLSKIKKQQLLFKSLLVALLSLLILMVWVGSSKEAASTLSNVMPKRTSAHAQDDIGKIISPMLVDDTFVLTFEDELPDPVSAQRPAPNETPVRTGDEHQLALIIDDVGYDMKALRRLLALPYALTFSILPDSPHAAEAARMAHQHGLTVMLHMPMQTSNPKYQQKMERFYLHQDMDKQTFTTVFEEALAKVPHVVGINNHMGSRLTEDTKSMQWLAELCKKHNLFLIDSRTSSASVAAQVANDAGIAWNERDIFLDHSVKAEALQHAWESALSCMKRNEHCLMLAHPHNETLDFLEQKIQDFNPQRFVPITTILH